LSGRTIGSGGEVLGEERDRVVDRPRHVGLLVVELDVVIGLDPLELLGLGREVVDLLP
jgi:hypothetical protein